MVRCVVQRSTFPLHDQIAGGDLRDRLAAWRAEDLSFATIALKLHEMDIEVSPSTVHRWCHDLGIEAA